MQYHHGGWWVVWESQITANNRRSIIIPPILASHWLRTGLGAVTICQIIRQLLIHWSFFFLVIKYTSKFYHEVWSVNRVWDLQRYSYWYYGLEFSSRFHHLKLQWYWLNDSAIWIKFIWNLCFDKVINIIRISPNYFLNVVDWVCKTRYWGKLVTTS